MDFWSAMAFTSIMAVACFAAGAYCYKKIDDTRWEWVQISIGNTTEWYKRLKL